MGVPPVERLVACASVAPPPHPHQDWSDNVGAQIGPGDRVGRNATYNRDLLQTRATSIIAAHDPSTPLYMYLAWQNVHEVSTGRGSKRGGQRRRPWASLIHNLPPPPVT